MRSTFMVMAVLLILLLGWYSQIAVELGLRHNGHAVPDIGLIAAIAALVLLMRRRPAMKSVTH